MFKSAYSFIPQSTVASKLNNDGILFLWNNQEEFGAVELLGQIHDSVVFQLPLSLPWSEHARILCALRDNLEKPVTWHTREFSIPTDCKAGFNLKEMKKVDWHKHPTKEQLTTLLSELFKEAKS